MCNKPKTCPWVFHYTLKSNLDKILEEGLVAQVGTHANLDGHKTGKVFVLTSIMTASSSACGQVDHHALMEYGDESSPEDWVEDNIVILAIRKEGLKLHPDPGYEGFGENPVAFYTEEDIPPDKIEWYTNHAETPQCCGKSPVLTGGMAIIEESEDRIFYGWIKSEDVIHPTEFLEKHYQCPVCGDIVTTTAVTYN